MRDRIAGMLAPLICAVKGCRWAPLLTWDHNMGTWLKCVRCGSMQFQK